ncbi:hypothetical protein BCCGELA001_28105 [Bradyrhizobium sp. CCGE-LA001]|nr:hypothetical protein BCCGELA001_28105 [Bradyrhizobium sp. CCGE-LA001]
MIEGSYGLLLRALAQTVFGHRRTVALLFRPREAIERKTARHTMKHWFLRIVSRLPRTKILTILPFSVDPRMSMVASGWIYDPQMWDLSVIERPQSGETSLTSDIRDRAAGRHIILALGTQNYEKGFDFLSRVWCGSEAIRSRYLFVVGGKTSIGSGEAAAKFRAAGGHLIDRYIEPFEFFALYELANAVWSCYSPAYDQASGIFGRAFQLGVPTIVREGSYLAALSRSIRHCSIELPFEDFRTAAQILLERELPVQRQTSTVDDIREVSLRTLKSAFAGQPLST